MTENAAKEAELIKHFGNGRLMGSDYGPIFVIASSFEEVARRRGELLREARDILKQMRDTDVLLAGGDINLPDRISAELGEG